MKLLKYILIGLLTLPLLPLFIIVGIGWLVNWIEFAATYCLTNSLNYSADLIDKLKQNK